MRNKNRWLAAMLTLSLALGDCGGMTALATENAVSTESTLSENNTDFNEKPEDETGEKEGSNDLSDSPAEDTSSEDVPTLPEADSAKADGTDKDKETTPEMKLPALHIGQISEDETLPSADDNAFIYDLPVSFATAESLILFVNYNIEKTPAYKETGTLEWSILRGEKGTEPGSANLLDEADDWQGFEEVPSSPYFTMEEITNAASGYCGMMTLVPEAFSAVVENTQSDTSGEAAEDYDYYIRAAYYPETEGVKTETFYSAATIPFLSENDPVTDADQIAGDFASTEKPTADAAQDGSSVSGNSSMSENSVGASDDALSGDAPSEGDTPAANETDSKETVDATDSENAVAGQVAEGTASENIGTEQTTEALSTVSGNNNVADVSTLAEGEKAPFEPETEGTLVLYSGVGTDEETILTKGKRIPMSPDDTLQITAKASPETLQPDIVWDSSDETVATVKTDGSGTATITAAAEGYARITASCRGITATFVVDVVPDKANPDSEKLLDLSGDIRIAGFVKESDDLVYNGQKITQNFRVYHKDTLLKEKTDYTLSYKNNVNAAAWNSSKAPSVTINLKGQYQGSVTLYYTIKPLDINDIDIYHTPKVSPGYEQTVNYSPKLNIPAPDLTYGKKKLSARKDFTCDYTKPGENMTALPADYTNGDLYAANTVYSYTVDGTGNFTGSFPMQLVVLKDKTRNFSSASVKFDQKQYEYHGTPLAKTDVRITEVKIGGQILAESLYNYDVYASGTEGAYVMVSPSEAGKADGYSGCKKVALKLVGDRQLKDAVSGADWKETIPFSQKTVDKDGGMFQTGTALLSYGEGTEKAALAEGTDYTVKYSNAKKAGKVTVTFTGKGRYQGTLRLNYIITPNTDIKIVMGKNVGYNNGTYETPYQKGGAVPELILKDQDYTVLKSKTDYTIKYKDNKTPGTPMTCEIKGKGSYAGYEKTVTLMVTKADIGNCTISIPDKPYSDKPDKWKSTITIRDVNGKKLAAKTDYDADFTFSHTQESSPQADTVVTVTVTGVGCYEETITGTYRIFSRNISTLKVVIDPQEYTGKEIKLKKSDIHIYATATDQKKGQELPWKDSCFEILESEYKNNMNAGTAKVTLRGMGEYGGTKTYSFKIEKKKYQINHVKGITLDKTSLSFPLAEQDEKKRTLTATLTSESNGTIANPTVSWTSSDSSIIAIEEKPDSVVTGSADGKKTVSVSVVLKLKKEGSVTITAVSQDGNKKAQCNATVIDAPVFLEADQTIKESIGNTYQLHMEFTPAQDKSRLKWESNNPEIVSVDQNGLLTMKKAGAAIIEAVYTSGSGKFIQQCYAVAIDENEAPPKPEAGALLTYNQKAGVTDDTPYINKMLRDFEWGDDTHVREVTLYLPAGVYHIDATAGGNDLFGKYKFGGIVLTTNQKLVMSPSALLLALPNSERNSQVINISGRDGVSVSGGQIIGERREHKGSSGEWGHGIAVFGGTNITISDVDISYCWGDGIYLGKYDNASLGSPSSDGITIKNCNLHHNRRNNLSITDASNVTVENCEFNYANGTAPEYGIDIEPNKNRTCSNVTISNCSFRGNAGGTIQILGQLDAHVKGVTIENCTGDKAPVKWSGFDGSVSDVKENGNKWGNP